MIIAVPLAALLLAAFAWLAPRAVRPLPPRTATYLLTGGALASTVVAIGVPVLLAATAVAQLPPVAALGEWSRPDLRATDPVPVWLATCCALLLVPPAVRGLSHAVRRARALMRLHRDCRGLDHGRSAHPADRVLVLDTDQPQAYATPAGGGRIVVTSGLLRALNADEQRVLLAHETAHLRHRHAWWVLAAELCAAVNPSLRGVARSTAHAVERWADESAATEVGDRNLVARSLARAALHVNAARRDAAPAVGVGVVGGEMPSRVRALLAPAPRPRPGTTLALALLLVASLGCAATVQRRTDAFFDLASTERPTATTHQRSDATVAHPVAHHRPQRNTQPDHR